MQLGLERKRSSSSASFPLKLIYRATDFKELKLDKSFDVASEKVGRTPIKKCWDMIRKISGKGGGQLFDPAF